MALSVIKGDNMYIPMEAVVGIACLLVGFVIGLIAQ
ncbi:hypothetical protein UAB78_061 [Escherichia phage UAB_Phi78]|nr:hypothetical protein I132_gp61 [Escherichia phage UAB_Phi78]QXM18137.1 hypothetical protein UAB78_061 [Escherichia phage UAB_Phi78]